MYVCMYVCTCVSTYLCSHISVYVYAQDTTEEDLATEDMEGENPEDYSIGVRGVVTISKGHQKMMLSVVFTNAIWVEKVGMHG